MSDKLKLTIAALVVLVLAFGGKKAYDMARGLRNNNPGNIRHGSQWLGMRTEQTDPDFVQFNESKYGIRALAKLLQNYQSLYGLNTVRGIIGRWAPPNENNTTSYVGSVAAALGVSPDAKIDVRTRAGDLVRAIIKHENGIQPYSIAELNAGLALADVPLIS